MATSPKTCRLGYLALATASAMSISARSIAGQDGRSYRPFPAEPAVQIGGVDDDILLNPGPLSCRDGRLIVFDYGDMKLKAFDLEGRTLWATGRRGSGPGEYLNPTDIKIGAGGEVIVRDPPNGRITYLSPRGSLNRSLSVQTQNHQILPLANRSLMIVGSSHTSFAVIIDSVGRQTGEIPLNALQRRTPGISRQTVIAQSEDGAGAIGYLYASGWSLVEPSGRMRAFPGVEEVPFPQVLTMKIGDKKQYTSSRVDPQANHGSHSIAIDANHVYARFGGVGPLAGRKLDVYSRASGSYLYTFELPEGTLTVSTCGDRLLLRFQDPVPMIGIYGSLRDSASAPSRPRTR